MNNQERLKSFPSSAMGFIEKAVDFCHSKEEGQILDSAWNKLTNGSSVIYRLPIHFGNDSSLGRMRQDLHTKQFEKHYELYHTHSTDPNSLNFYKKLFIFFDKFHEFTEKGLSYQDSDPAKAQVYLEATTAVLRICHEVADNYAEYKKNTLTLEAFQNKMDTILKESKEVALLRQHRGMKQILLDILTAFSKLAPSVLNFFAPKTDSFKKILDVTECAAQLNPNSKSKT